MQEKCNILVRDRIPELIERSGRTPKAKMLEDNEFLKATIAKLKEEVAQYEKNKTMEELVDIVEIVYSILKVKTVGLDEFERLRIIKNVEKGSYDLKIFLEKII